MRFLFRVPPADTGLIPVFDRSGKLNVGHALEVVVFHELQRRGALSGIGKPQRVMRWILQ